MENYSREELSPIPELVSLGIFLASTLKLWSYAKEDVENENAKALALRSFRSSSGGPVAFQIVRK